MFRKYIVFYIILYKVIKLLPKQHTFSYIFTIIAYYIDTTVISELKKLNKLFKYLLYVNTY